MFYNIFMLNRSFLSFTCGRTPKPPLFAGEAVGVLPNLHFLPWEALGVLPSLHFLIGEAVGVVPRPYFLPGQALGILPKAQFWFGQAVGAVASIAFCRRKIQGQVKDHRIMIIFKTETKNKNRLHKKPRIITSATQTIVAEKIKDDYFQTYPANWHVKDEKIRHINELATILRATLL